MRRNEQIVKIIPKRQNRHRRTDFFKLKPDYDCQIICLNLQTRCRRVRLEIQRTFLKLYCSKKRDDCPLPDIGQQLKD